MRILITTGIYPPQIGGPAQYAKNLADSFQVSGIRCQVVTYGWISRLPSGLRHIVFFLKILPALMSADFAVTLDTMSVGLPTVLAGLLLGKKVIIRTGGDFLWEGYVERTSKKVLLRNFYQTETDNFNLKEKLIFRLTRLTLKRASQVIFSTEWQRGIWQKPYKLDLSKTGIIENYYGPAESTDNSTGRSFIGFTRVLKWKNLDVLKSAFAQAQKRAKDIILDIEPATYGLAQERIKACYGVILVSFGDISPNLILDAIRLGKPFIVTEENGLTNRIDGLGLSVNPLDERAIIEKIELLLDPIVYETYRQKLKQFTFTHSWEEIANEFLTCYQKTK